MRRMSCQLWPPRELQFVKSDAIQQSLDGQARAPGQRQRALLDQIDEHGVEARGHRLTRAGEHGRDVANVGELSAGRATHDRMGA